MSDPVYRVTATVHGRVQGVGFRNWTVAEVAARRLSVAGLVRNQVDGTVEVIAESAERAVLENLVSLLKIGPTHARVDNVHALYENGVPPRYSGFLIG